MMYTVERISNLTSEINFTQGNLEFSASLKIHTWATAALSPLPLPNSSLSSHCLPKTAVEHHQPADKMRKGFLSKILGKHEKKEKEKHFKEHLVLHPELYLPMKGRCLGMFEKKGPFRPS